MQAMDRAHRLGQRRTVNVYRLLVRGTLEEHIMGLQRFKLDVAGAPLPTPTPFPPHATTAGSVQYQQPFHFPHMVISIEQPLSAVMRNDSASGACTERCPTVQALW